MSNFDRSILGINSQKTSNIYSFSYGLVEYCKENRICPRFNQTKPIQIVWLGWKQSIRQISPAESGWIITNFLSSSIPWGCGGVTNLSSISPNGKFDRTALHIEKLAFVAKRNRKGTYAGLPDLLKKILCDALWNTSNGSGSLFSKIPCSCSLMNELCLSSRISAPRKAGCLDQETQIQVRGQLAY